MPSESRVLRSVLLGGRLILEDLGDWEHQTIDRQRENL